MISNKKSIAGLLFSSLFIVPHMIFLICVIIEFLHEALRGIINLQFPSSSIIGNILLASITTFGIIFYSTGILFSVLLLFVNKNKTWVKFILWCYIIILSLTLFICIMGKVTGVNLSLN